RALFDEEGSKAGAGKSDAHEASEGSEGKFSEQAGREVSPGDSGHNRDWQFFKCGDTGRGIGRTAETDAGTRAGNRKTDNAGESSAWIGECGVSRVFVGKGRI
ncbi:MAG: hypothetical protein AAB013_05770, partial [Planctomycetota bacterium]